MVAGVVPPGACVATDQASFLLLANRFTSSVSDCSQMVDGLGTDLALSRGRRPASGAGRVPAVMAAWNHAFRTAGYVLLSDKSSLRIPRTSQLTGLLPPEFHCCAARVWLHAVQAHRAGRDGQSRLGE